MVSRILSHHDPRELLSYEKGLEAFRSFLSNAGEPAQVVEVPYRGSTAMAEYIEIEEARAMNGLRVVLTPGVPGPWSEAVKGLLYVKKLAYMKVRQQVGSTDLALRQWTAQESAPVMVWNDERPRSVWIDQLYLVERLQPDPPLIPANLEDRVLMFGYANELCGENGLGWSKRLMLVQKGMSGCSEADRQRASYFGQKYGYQEAAAHAAPARVVAILHAFSARLDRQRRHGSPFLVGEGLTAVDIYWATFAGSIDPLPEELCPMPEAFRRVYSNTDPTIKASAAPILFEHRDFIYQNFLELPMDF